MSEHSGHHHILELLSNLTKTNIRPRLQLGRSNSPMIHSQRSFTLNLTQDESTKSRQKQKEKQMATLKSQMQLQYKTPWKGTGTLHTEQPYKRLSHKHELDNWQISRLQLSKRSYNYPKEYRGLKIPQKGRQFEAFTERDKEGHLPYLYQNDIKKYESLKERMNMTPFKIANSVRHQYFGFGTHKYLGRKLQHKINKGPAQSSKQLTNLSNFA